MKHPIRLAFFCLLAFLLVDCDSDQVTKQLAKHDQAAAVIYSITRSDGDYKAEPITLERVEASVKTKEIKTRNPNHSSTGIYNFPPFGDDYQTLTFSAIQNNGGVHGNTHLTGSEGAGTLDVKIDSDCLLVNGDKAYWGGTITRWIVTQAYQDFFDNVIGGVYEGFGVGDAIYFSARDTGEGSGSSGPDEGGDAFIVVASEFNIEDFGLETWCEFTELDYAGTYHPPFTHGYIPGAVPSNIQIK